MVNVQETGVQFSGTAQCIASTTFNICPLKEKLPSPFLQGAAPTIFEKCSPTNIFSSRKPEVMLCYVMLCYVMLCYVMLCYVMLCYVMLCYVMLCYVMLCYVMLCYVMLCYVMLCYVMLLCSIIAKI